MSSSPRWRFLRLLYLWHRRLGIAALLLFVILVITGLMLNHTQSLRLDQRPVTSNWLLAWYGMTPARPEMAFRIGEHYLLQQLTQLFLDTQPLPSSEETLVGAAWLNGMAMAVTETRLLAYTLEGELIESQPLPKQLADKVARAGVWNDRLLLATRDDMGMSIDGNLLEWRMESIPPAVEWSRPVPPPVDLAEALQAVESPLNMERLVLDLHSGRLFGRNGVYVMDGAAVVLLLLGLSGGYLWLRQHLRRHQVKSKE